MRTPIATLLRFSLLTLLLASLLTACGGDSQRGKTACGVSTCFPGQYCLNLACVPGCQSNDNCAADQTCQDISSGSHSGTCQNNGGTTSDMTSTDTTCKPTCDKLVQCGLFTVADGVLCQNGCLKWTADQQKVYGECAAAWDCSGTTAPVCLGSTCGGKYQCANGNPCTQHSCF